MTPNDKSNSADCWQIARDLDAIRTAEAMHNEPDYLPGEAMPGALIFSAIAIVLAVWAAFILWVLFRLGGVL